jgi:hypothetical protein
MPTMIFFVTGGFGGHGAFHETEVLTESGWQLTIPSLPVNVYHHCMVLLNSTAAMVIGGIQNSVISPKTYIISNDKRVKFFDKL